MKVSIEWLRDYVELEASSDELVDVFPMLGMEVEEVKSSGPAPMEKVVVGEVLTREKHPEADKLSVCEVKVGEDDPVAKIVCGAQNFQPGDRVPVALPGAKLPGGFKIKKSKLRGVQSEGMMCSAKELELGDDHEGLLILENRPEIGLPIHQAFGEADFVFDLELTANRGDLLGHFGVAREIAARYDKSLKLPEVFTDAPTLTAPTEKNPLRSLSVQTENCPLYLAWAVKGVKIGPSPEWLRQRLEAVGLRAINNVVDVTNYVLMETGQPLHAFDAAKIAGSEIIVRQATSGETITTLDEVERTLDESDMVIADAKKPLVVAGIMGSVDAEVDDSTTDLVLEAAWFRPGAVRATSRKLGLHTDSSLRFARDVDPQATRYAARRALDLILQTAGGELVAEEIQVGKPPRADRSIKLPLDFVRQNCGFPAEDEEIVSTLRRLDYGVEETGEPGRLLVKAPAYRSDVERPIDLVEEYLRGRGADTIPEARVSLQAVSRDDSPLFTFSERAADSLVGLGFRECVHYSLRDGKEVKAWHGPETAELLELANPLTADHTHLRASLLPGLLDALAHNRRNQNDLRRVFETGRILRPGHKGATEYLSIAFAILVQPAAREWKPEAAPDLHEAKLVAQRLLAATGVSMPRGGLRLLPAGASPAWQDGHAATAGDAAKTKSQLDLGVCSLGLSRAKGVKGPVLAAELILDPVVLSKKPKTPKFQPFGAFPPANRDLALLVDADVPAEEVRQAVEQAAAQATGKAFQIEQVSVFDLFVGTGLPKGKKSIACTLRFRAPDRTLEDKEVNAAFEKAQQTLTQITPYELRS